MNSWEQRRYKGLLAFLLEARTLLGAPGTATRSKDASRGAPGIATRSKDATRGAPGIATRKDATRDSWHRY